MSKEMSKEIRKQLAKCPFCGGEAELERGLIDLDNYVQCVSCRCRTKLYNTKKSAIKAWNTRKPMQNIVERLENHIRYCELCHEEFNDSRMSLTYEVQLNSYKNAIEIVKEEGGMNEN